MFIRFRVVGSLVEIKSCARNEFHPVHSETVFLRRQQDTLLTRKITDRSQYTKQTNSFATVLLFQFVLLLTKEEKLIILFTFTIIHTTKENEKRLHKVAWNPLKKNIYLIALYQKVVFKRTWRKNTQET